MAKSVISFLFMRANFVSFCHFAPCRVLVYLVGILKPWVVIRLLAAKFKPNAMLLCWGVRRTDGGAYVN